MKNAVQQANQRLAKKLILLVVMMFGFGFALVPLYDVMCKQLGINGKPDVQTSAKGNVIDNSRTIEVLFLATNNENLPWTFQPNIRKIRLHPGENTHISFHAQNNSDQAMTVQAIPSIAPGLAARYLKKTECFCFTQQRLAAHKEQDMPILFHLDNDIPNDIHSLTLSYTLFHIKNPSNIIENSSTAGHIDITS